MESFCLTLAHWLRVLFVVTLVSMYSAAFAMARWVSTNAEDWGLWSKCDKGKFLVSDPDKCQSIGRSSAYFEGIRALACFVLISLVIQLGIVREGQYIDKRKWPCFFAIASSLMAGGTVVLFKVTYGEDDRWKDDSPSVGDSWILTLCVSVLSAMLCLFNWWFDEKRRQPDIDSQHKNSVSPLPVSPPPDLAPRKPRQPPPFSQTTPSAPSKVAAVTFVVSSHWREDQDVSSEGGADVDARIAAAAAGGITTRRRLAPLERRPVDKNSGSDAAEVREEGEEEELPRKSGERRRKRRRHKKRRGGNSPGVDITRNELYSDDLRSARSRSRDNAGIVDPHGSGGGGQIPLDETLYSYTLPPVKGAATPAAPPPSYNQATGHNYLDMPPPPAVTVLNSPFT